MVKTVPMILLSPGIQINNFTFKVCAGLLLESTFPDCWVAGQFDNNTSSAPAGLCLSFAELGKNGNTVNYSGRWKSFYL